MEALDSFKPIRQYQPDRLYIAADGPRDHVKNEKEDCQEVRQAILNLIDWPCEVKTLFRENNLGCSEAIYGGVSWFFEHEEYGVVNEDDVVISQDFFKMCELLLPYYKDEEKIMLISTRNHSGKYKESDEYVFAYQSNIWGWASWRRAWSYNDNTFKGWKEYPKLKVIKKFGILQGLDKIRCYNKCANPNNVFFSWDYAWNCHILMKDGIVIDPKVNLSTNVGIGVAGSTNYSVNDEDPYAELGVGRIKWPLKIKTNIDLDTWQLKADRKDFYRKKVIGLKKIIRNRFNMR